MTEHGIEPIDLLVVNLYPFEATVAAAPPSTSAIENIDIGGPAMIRAAAKNHAHVAVVTDAGGLCRACSPSWQRTAARRTSTLRKRLAAQGLRAHRPPTTRRSSTWFARADAAAKRCRRATSRFAGTLAEPALRREPAPVGGVLLHRRRRATASPRREQLQGKELSYNNINDTDAAFELVAEFDPGTAGRAPSSSTPIPAASRSGATLRRGLRARAATAIRSSAFGGIVAVNRTLDAATARARSPRSSPRWSSRPTPTTRRCAIFAAKKNLRLLIDRRPARPARAGADVARRSPAASWCRSATTAAIDDATCKVVHQAPADRRARSPTCCFAFTRGQAREVERHRLRQGRRDRRHRRRPDEPRRFRAHRRLRRRRKRPRRPACRSRWPRARSSPPTPSSPSPTACSPPPRPAPPR